MQTFYLISLKITNKIIGFLHLFVRVYSILERVNGVRIRRLYHFIKKEGAISEHTFHPICCRELYLNMT